MQREKEGGFHFKSTANFFFREGFHHNVENNGLCALKVQPTHSKVMCRVMNKSQLFCERGSGMWQESSIRPKFWELSSSRTVPGIKIWLNSTLQMDGWVWILEETRHLLCKVPQISLRNLTHKLYWGKNFTAVPSPHPLEKFYWGVYQAFYIYWEFLCKHVTARKSF
jgi:hypothetical protein